MNDPGTFVYEVPGSGAKPSSFVQMQSFHIIKHSEPLNKFKVSFVIEPPESPRWLISPKQLWAIILQAFLCALGALCDGSFCLQ